MLRPTQYWNLVKDASIFHRDYGGEGSIATGKVPMYAGILVVAVFSPLASAILTLAVAAFYLPSAALFAER